MDEDRFLVLSKEEVNDVGGYIIVRHWSMLVSMCFRVYNRPDDPTSRFCVRPPERLG
jgi:hypothetical protein